MKIKSLLTPDCGASVLEEKVQLLFVYNFSVKFAIRMVCYEGKESCVSPQRVSKCRVLLTCISNLVFFLFMISKLA